MNNIFGVVEVWQGHQLLFQSHEVAAVHRCESVQGGPLQARAEG